jgi:hypothetical protein
MLWTRVLAGRANISSAPKPSVVHRRCTLSAPAAKKQSPPVSDSRAVLHSPDKRETWVITCERMALICARRKKQNEKFWILRLTESVLKALHDKQSDAIQRHLAVPFALGLGSQFNKE